MYTRCVVCGKRLSQNPHVAVLEDGTIIRGVGSECYKRITKSGIDSRVGTLYKAVFDACGVVVKIIK